MAAPSEVNIGDLSGVWTINKTLSDDTDAVLALQGVGWFKRKAIAIATVTLYVKQYKDDAGVVHIDIEQTVTGGIKGTTELRALDGVQRPHEDHLFGSLVGHSKWVTLDTLEDNDDYLKGGWLESEEGQGPNGEKFVQSLVVNEKGGWNGNQLWGFAEVNGERRYTRLVIVSKGEEVLKIRMVYDWHGKQ